MLAKNVGNIDRIVRIVAGLGLLSLLFVMPLMPWGLVGGLVGAVLLFTAFASSCPAYSILGLSTCEKSDS